MTRARLRPWTPARVLLLVLSVAACGVVPGVGDALDRPDNPKAIAPIAVVVRGSGAAGEFRVWAYRTSDGMACIELASTGGSTSTCDPTGRPPLGGSGVNRSARGVVAWAATGEVTATTAVVHDASGAETRVALVDVGPTMARVKVAVASLGPSANPVAIDFMDAAGSTVESVGLR